MTKEQIKQKADMYIRDFHSTELSETDLILFAEQLINEATKELKERNAELKEEVNKIAFARGSLEEENAELKKDNEGYEKDNTLLVSQFNQTSAKLTKAKEIINDCVCELQNILFYKMRNKERIASTLDKAEQFISEVEK